MSIHTVTQTHLAKAIDAPSLLAQGVAPQLESQHAALNLSQTLKLAMRQLASGVSIITTGLAPHRTGFTATSVTPLSVEPPRVLVCVNKNASSYSVIKDTGFFAINLLQPQHQPLADDFAGRGGVKGEARFATSSLQTLKTGASILADALAAIDCTVEELIERHSHAIVIGRVEAVQKAHHHGSAIVAHPDEALLYWQGQYETFSPR